jgi:hypothetical protein
VKGFVRMTKKMKTARPTKRTNGASAKRDDFESVARRLGADEDKDRFEAKLRKIASAKHQPQK